ncbi:hypothetical protein Sste5346_010312 [Sporothrix stenoceras]|uniref:VOC domain-containing protein n=1 Tax=Sporothrix stenoceras TaxID=5173 RepID=A0ABR3YG35_9PEZI
MPVVEFKSKPWRSVNSGRVILARPVWAHYGHVDTEKAHKFAIDFGLTETSRSSTPERIYYKGYNDQPVIYVSEKTAHPTYFGSAMEAATEEDLEHATKVPGAGPIRNSEFPGGGKVVTIMDPDGIPFHVVYGYEKVPVGPTPIAAEAYNNAQLHDDEKARRGKYQRLPKGPSAVFKLGHFGHMSSDVGAISAWYMQHFNIRAMDVQADMKDDTQVRIF